MAAKKAPTLSRSELYQLPVDEISGLIPDWPYQLLKTTSLEEEYETRTGDKEERLDEIFDQVAMIRVRDALQMMTLTTGLSSLAAILLQIAVKEIDNKFDTMAVAIRGDGVVRLLFNSIFVSQLRGSECSFGLAHEAQHVLLAHLQSHSVLAADEQWVMATEGTINHRVKKVMAGLNAMPPSVVDPVVLYNRYKTACKKQNQPTVTIEEFYITDRDCYAHLKRVQPSLRGFKACDVGATAGDCPTCDGEGSIDAPAPRGKNQNGSGQKDDDTENDDAESGDGEESDGSGDGEGSGEGEGSGDSEGSGEGAGEGSGEGSGNGSGSQGGSQGPGSGHGSNGKIPCPTCAGSGSSGAGNPFDPETLKHAVEGALGTAIKDAMAGDTGMAEALKDLEAITPDASDMWGNLGMGALRGESTTGKAHSMWARLLARAIQSKLGDERERPAYDRKTGHIPTPAGMGRPLGPVGFGEETLPLIAIDASGSMQSDVLRRVGKMIGMIEGAHPQWVSFDATVWPFEAGETFQGGGGTSFAIIEEYIEKEMEEYPDAVIVVTDGYAPPILPKHRDRWIWLVVAGGDGTWIQDRGMRVIQVDDLSAMVGA